MPDETWRAGLPAASRELRDALTAAEGEASKAYARYEKKRAALMEAGVNPLEDSDEAKGAVADLEQLQQAYHAAVKKAEGVQATIGALSGEGNREMMRRLPYAVGLDGNPVGDPGTAFSNWMRFSAAFDQTSGGVAVPPFVTGLFAKLAHRPLNVLEIIPRTPVSGLGGETLHYLSQKAYTPSAAAVAQLATKPTTVIGVERLTTTLHTVATISEPVARQLLVAYDDLTSFINTELSLAVLEQCEDYVLNGSGSSQPRGILNTSGIGTRAKGADTGEAAIRKAITTLENQNIFADAVVLHPSDFEQMELETDAEGNYMLGGPRASEPGALWRVKVVRSKAIAAGTGLVGNWALGARWFEGDARIAFSEHTGTSWETNTIVFLAELGFASVATRAAYFVSVTGL